MYKLIFILIFFSSNLFAHTSHYKSFKKIEIEIFKDDNLIGYNYYFFTSEGDTVIVKSQLQFKINLFGVEVFNIDHYGVEKYKENKLISYQSKTLQNDKQKFVDLFYDTDKKKFNIKGSSFTGFAETNNILGNWWNHQILMSKSQISPVSGSVKDQVVNFVGKEKMKFHGKIIDVDHFKLTSKNTNLPKNKKLDFDIWYNDKNGMIIKVSYSRLGSWEYKLKSFE